MVRVMEKMYECMTRNRGNHVHWRRFIDVIIYASFPAPLPTTIATGGNSINVIFVNRDAVAIIELKLEIKCYYEDQEQYRLHERSSKCRDRG